MIGHNSQPDCARESVKPSSHLEDSESIFCGMLRVRVTSLWCDFGETRFCTLSKNWVVFIPNAVEQKLNTLEINFLHNVSYDRPFANAIDKNEVFLGG